VRGYDPREVLTTARMTVANAEVRVPLVGPFGRISRSNALPIDALLFADAGALDTASGARTMLAQRRRGDPLECRRLRLRVRRRPPARSDAAGLVPRGQLPSGVLNKATAEHAETAERFGSANSAISAVRCF
jgi:hypothetical protein